jgi:uncharacterized protein
LEREGSLEIRSEIPARDPSWEGTEFRFSAPLSVSGQVQWIPSGEVLARLRLRGLLAQECRRCLEPVDVPVDEELELLFAPMEESDDPDEENVRPLPENAGELDLIEAIREEVVLTQTLLALCRTDCQGLCPQCGTNLNESSCQCSREEADPRWNALRALNRERD